MIDKKDLEGYGTFKEKYQIEKDYLQDLLLFSIYEGSTDQMVFKGGTALSKFYGSGRFSEDLDFTLRNAGERDAISIIETAVGKLAYKTEYEKKPIANKFGTIEAIIGVRGPRYNGKMSTVQKIIFEVNTRATLLLAPSPIPYEPVYSDADRYVALVMDRNEILAEKVRAIMGAMRKHKERDLYDMYFLISKGATMDRALVLRKLSESAITPSAERLDGAIRGVAGTWPALAPFVRGGLADYSDASGAVSKALREAGLL
jgi:predicted nucleotidyltransferase component of viral defense system